MNETKPKKVVGRSVAITLGAICIILVVVGLVGAVMYVMPTINDKDNTISSLNLKISQSNTNSTNLQDKINQLQAWLDGNITAYNSLQSTYNSYVGGHSYTNQQYQNLQNQISSLNAQITSLQSQVNDLNNIVNLADSTVWVNDQTVSEPAGGLGISWHDWTFSANYAGYITITVLSSTTGAWTHVVYSSYGVSYNVQTNVGTSGTAYFPVLPSSSITVGVGNGNLNSGATETVTITYHY